jgi:hypothetical protein
MTGRKPNLLSVLGQPVPYAHVIIFYLPNKDMDGKEFDVDPWDTERTMAKISKKRIGTLLKAEHREAVKTPFYYAPPFLDEVRRSLQERLASKGGRPTVPEWEVVRKTRYSKETWAYLNKLAAEWSKAGVSVSPSQVAARIVEQIVCRQS